MDWMCVCVCVCVCVCGGLIANKLAMTSPPLYGWLVVRGGREGVSRVRYHPYSMARVIYIPKTMACNAISYV